MRALEFYSGVGGVQMLIITQELLFKLCSPPLRSDIQNPQHGYYSMWLVVPRQDVPRIFHFSMSSLIYRFHGMKSLSV